MDQGLRVTDEKKKEVLAAIVKDRTAGIPMKVACKKHGISDNTFYAWSEKLNGHRPYTPPLAKVTEPLACGVVQESEALRWIAANRGAHGRFASLKEEIVTAVSRLHKNQSWTFAGPTNPKDVPPIATAVTRALKVAGLPYAVRHYKAKNFFIVVREEALKSNG
jgi:transposase